jgi:hypothetical protein
VQMIYRITCWISSRGLKDHCTIPTGDHRVIS